MPERPQGEFTISQCLAATARTLDFIDRCDRVFNDNKRSERIEEQKCRFCFYTEALAGQTMTSTSCGWCVKKFIWGNNRPPKLCRSCAEELDICVQCGADMKLRTHRKRLR